MSEPLEVRETRVVNVHQQPISVRLTRGAKGAYRWEIQVHASEPAEALHLLDYLDEELKRRYGQPQTDDYPKTHRKATKSQDLFPRTPSELWRRVEKEASKR